MARKGVSINFEHLKILSAEQEDSIHQATLSILKNTGVKFDHEIALEIFAKAGCSIDRTNNRVRIPEELVLDAIEKCPSTMHVKARNPENDLIMVPGKVTYYTNSIGFNYHDPVTGENREPSRKEFYDHVRIVDALPNIDLQNAFPFWGFENVPQCMRLLESNAAKLRLSDKAMMEGTTFDNYKFIIEMAKATNQDILQLVNPTAPLTYFKDTVDQIFYTADADMPFHLCPGLAAGASGPATLAGLVASNNAVILAGIVLTQLYRPGTRMWVGSMIMTSNMKTGSPAFGDIGNSLAEAAFCQMWRRYQIPCWTSAGAWTSSKLMDYQAGYELTTGMIMNSLTGSNMILFQGGLTAELAVNTEKLIMDDDLAGMIKRFLAGMEVSEDTLALDVIEDVGPMPGNFLTHEHTFEWWRKECYIPAVADREPYQTWLENGKMSAYDHAKIKKELILSNHKDKRLTPEGDKALEDILQKAREYYRNNGAITEQEWELYQKDLSSPNYPFA